MKLGPALAILRYMQVFVLTFFTVSWQMLDGTSPMVDGAWRPRVSNWLNIGAVCRICLLSHEDLRLCFLMARFFLADVVGKNTSSLSFDFFLRMTNSTPSEVIVSSLLPVGVDTEDDGDCPMHNTSSLRYNTHFWTKLTKIIELMHLHVWEGLVWISIRIFEANLGVK